MSCRHILDLVFFKCLKVFHVMKEAWKNGSSARWLKFADLWIFKKWLLFIQLHGILTTASKVRRAGGECVRHSLQKQYLIVVALETSFVEDNFWMGWGRGGWFWGWVKHIMFILPLFLLLLHQLHLRSSGIRSQSWGPLVYCVDSIHWFYVRGGRRIKCYSKNFFLNGNMGIY